MARRTLFVRAIALLSSLSLAACGSGINNDDPPDDVADLEDLDWLDGGDWEDDAAAMEMDGAESSAPSADATCATQYVGNSLI